MGNNPCGCQGDQPLENADQHSFKSQTYPIVVREEQETSKIIGEISIQENGQKKERQLLNNMNKMSTKSDLQSIVDDGPLNTNPSIYCEESSIYLFEKTTKSFMEIEEPPVKVKKMNDLNEKSFSIEKKLGKYRVPAASNTINRRATFEGPYKYLSGVTYFGAFDPEKHGEREGVGRQIWQDGSVYDGQWLKNKREGKGRQIFLGGEYYEGDWKNDQADGYGAYTGKGGIQYRGGFVENKQHGNGEEKRADGTNYLGGWQMGLKHGIGTHKWADGSCYKGKFKEDYMNGYGKFLA